MAAGLGYIEFTTGDILTAATANGYLASQTVMVFASAAARTSAITSPQEGMISFLKDTDTMQYYSGSAWVNVSSAASTAGLTFIAKQSFTTASAVNLTSKFSSTYDNYRIIIQVTTGSASQAIYCRLRSGSTDETGSNYRSGREFTLGTGVTAAGDTTGTNTFFAQEIMDWNSQQSYASMDLYAPFLTANTSYTSQSVYYFSAFGHHNQYSSGQMSVTTSYDGITFYPSAGTMTGTVYLYGYNNS